MFALIADTCFALAGLHANGPPFQQPGQQAGAATRLPAGQAAGPGPQQPEQQAGAATRLPAGQAAGPRPQQPGQQAFEWSPDRLAILEEAVGTEFGSRKHKHVSGILSRLPAGMTHLGLSQINAGLRLLLRRRLGDDGSDLGDKVWEHVEEGDGPIAEGDGPSVEEEETADQHMAAAMKAVLQRIKGGRGAARKLAQSTCEEALGGPLSPVLEEVSSL